MESHTIQNDGTTIIIWVASNDIIGGNGAVLALLDKNTIPSNTRAWSVETNPKNDFETTSQELFA